MVNLRLGTCALCVCMAAMLVSGCGQTNGALAQSNADTPPSGTARTIPGSTRGTNCVLPFETGRRVNRWALFKFGHCANGGFVPEPGKWSSSGGHLRPFHDHEKARFEASSPGTYTITASCCGGSWQSTIKVRQ